MQASKSHILASRIDSHHPRKTQPFTLAQVAGEAAGIAMGLLLAGTGSEKAAEMLAYAHDTQHEKIIRGEGFCPCTPTHAHAPPAHTPPPAHVYHAAVCMSWKVLLDRHIVSKETAPHVQRNRTLHVWLWA